MFENRLESLVNPCRTIDCTFHLQLERGRNVAGTGWNVWNAALKLLAAFHFHLFQKLIGLLSRGGLFNETFILDCFAANARAADLGRISMAFAICGSSAVRVRWAA